MKYSENLKALRSFLILFATQSFSALGSSMTSFALVVWSFQQQGSALRTALLTVCSYAPYVMVSIFAGAISDRWNKKTIMLVCDTFAAMCTLATAVLLHMGRLEIWHLYVLNALNGLMNTFQQPATDVTITLITPKAHYQLASGLRSLANSLCSILAPALATAMLTLAGIHTVILFDLLTFAAAFVSLLFWIHIPVMEKSEEMQEPMLDMAKSGLLYLRKNPGILHLMLFLAAINFTASVYNAAFPAMVLSRAGGGQIALGVVNSVAGAAMIAGSILAGIWPKPKSRVRMICNTLLLSMSTENFLLAFGKSLPVWCFGAVLGWIGIPLMNANLDVVFRQYIPVEMQGRVYSARNTLQFFTIPIGYVAGGYLVDRVFEPLMATQEMESGLVMLFGSGKGSGAACLFAILWLVGLMTCLVFRRDRHIWMLEKE
ncbi:MAG: MFS transporter [Candidatus Ventricola sp.]